MQTLTRPFLCRPLLYRSKRTTGSTSIRRRGSHQAMSRITLVDPPTGFGRRSRDSSRMRRGSPRLRRGGGRRLSSWHPASSSSPLQRFSTVTSKIANRHLACAPHCCAPSLCTAWVHVVVIMRALIDAFIANDEIAMMYMLLMLAVQYKKALHYLLPLMPSNKFQSCYKHHQLLLSDPIQRCRYQPNHVASDAHPRYQR